MDRRKRIEPTNKVAVRLTQRQRKLIVEETFAAADHILLDAAASEAEPEAWVASQGSLEG